MRIIKSTLCIGLTLLVIGLYSCSQNEVLPQESVVNSRSAVPAKTVSSQSITVGELIEVVKSDCEDYELSFLNSLPKDMQIYVYPKGSKTYPAIKNNEVNSFSALIRNREMTKATPLKMLSSDKMDLTISASARGITEARSIRDWRILAVNGSPFGYVEVVDTFNYIYDIQEHVITEAVSMICDIDDSDIIGEYVFDWADKGSSLRVSEDRFGLSYFANGDIILGKAIGGLPVGLVCYEFRGETGNLLVPYNL